MRSETLADQMRADGTYSATAAPGSPMLNGVVGASCIDEKARRAQVRGANVLGMTPPVASFRYLRASK